MTDTLQAAADAVRTHFAGDSHTVTPAGMPRLGVAVPYSPTHVAALNAVREALKDGHTIPLIAARAQMRQLFLAQFVEDESDYMRALATARHDADRYRDQVIEAQRLAALKALAEGVSKTDVAQMLGVSRVTLYGWIAKAADLHGSK